MNDVTQARAAFLAELIEAGHFIPTSVPGLYGRGTAFEDIIQRFGALLDKFSEQDGADRKFFPPLVPRTTLEKAGYLESMPQLCGCVHSFFGDEREHRSLVQTLQDGGSWTEFLKTTELALAPAACYPLYPTLAGRLPEGGILADLGAAYVFRHEPSDDPARLQVFRQREMVRVGEPDQVAPWRNSWLERGLKILQGLGLNASAGEAHDPFFGRTGRMRAASQLEQKLKFELTVPICSEESPTAVTSFNYHRTHFGDTFGIQLADGTPAHSACLGFGVERIALALLKTHGLNPSEWPNAVRAQLWNQ